MSAARTYRRVMAVYPRAWRDRHEAEMLGVLADRAAETGDGRASWGEAGALVAGGLEARVDHAARGIPGPVRSRIALLAVVSGAALSSVLLAFGEVPRAGDGPVPDFFSHWGPVMTTAVVPCVLWVLALVALVARRRGAARWLSTAAGMGAAAAPAVEHLTGAPRAPLYLLAVFGVLAVLGTVGRPAGEHPWGALTGAVAVAAALATTQLNQPSTPYDGRAGFYIGFGGVHALVQLVPWLLAAGVLLAALLSIRGRPWFTAAVVTAVPWTYLVLAGWGFDARSNLYAIVVLSVGLVALAVAAALAAAAGVRVEVRQARD